MPEMIIKAREAAISENLNVRRILPFRKKRMVGPFIFMDHAGPIHASPTEISSLDVLPHPHIGLSTVTYLFGGQVTHRDSLGVEQIIKPGAVNWMTAGKGITHSERFEDPDLLSKDLLEMMQTWVALPEKVEECSAEFTNYQPDELPTFTDKGIWMRLIAGDAYGLGNKVATHSPLFYLHVKLDSGAKLDLPQQYSERGVYIAKGEIEVHHRSHAAGQMLVFKKGENPTLKALENTVIMLLGGEPLGERFIWWNFVSSQKERIEQAKADWLAGRMKLPPTDDKEFVPLPESKTRPVSSEPPLPNLLS